MYTTTSQQPCTLQGASFREKELRGLRTPRICYFNFFTDWVVR